MDQNKKVIYTVLIGDYDFITEFPKPGGWDLVMLTDRRSEQATQNSTWTFIDIDKSLAPSPQLLNRWYKLHPHTIFQNYEESLYIDSNIVLNDFEALQAAIESLQNRKALLSAPIHPFNSCLYTELNNIVNAGFDTYENIAKTRQLLEESEYPYNNGLFDNSILYRKHHSPTVIKLMDDWWNHLNKYSNRDQATFCYFLWKHQVQCQPLFGKYSTSRSRYDITYLKHKKSIIEDYSKKASFYREHTRYLSADLSEIPTKKSIAIWGASNAARMLIYQIESHRNDISISCFIDSYKTDLKTSPPTYTPSNIPDSVDTIIIASSFIYEILQTLDTIRLQTGKVFKVFSSHPQFRRYTKVTTFWDHLWTPFLKNSVNIEKIKHLKRGLDTESIKHIDHTTELYLQFFSNKNLSNDILVPEDIAWHTIDLDYRQQFKRFSDCEFPRIISKYYHSTPFNPYIFFNKYGLCDVLEKVVPYLENKSAIDCGAYTGDTTCMLLEEFKIKNVFAYEPDKSAQKELATFISRNKIEDKVTISSKGIGDRCQTITLYKNSDGLNAGASFAPPNENFKTFGEEVEVTTIDAEVNKHKITVGLIKMDIEGFEKNAVIGAMKTITKHKPVLVISIYHNPTDFFEIKPLLESLNLRYTFLIRRAENISPLCDLVLIALPLAIEKESAHSLL